VLRSQNFFWPLRRAERPLRAEDLPPASRLGLRVAGQELPLNKVRSLASGVPRGA